MSEASLFEVSSESSSFLELASRLAGISKSAVSASLMFVLVESVDSVMRASEARNSWVSADSTDSTWIS